jgi:undecaprenyl diphosphate synthase
MDSPLDLHSASAALPKHVAIIMDGNGRWAKLRGQPRMFGHHAGAKSLRKVVSMAGRLGIQELTLFAFSSENWKRPEEEVSSLMKLFLVVLQREIKNFDKNNVKLRIIGDTSRFNDELRERIRQAQEKTANNDGLTLNIAANYGGRWDVAQAFQTLATLVSRGELDASDIDEDMISQAMVCHSTGDVDLMIRTGGDQRISNFLIWQMAYAELYFSDLFWPDFDDLAFGDALASYVNRERRFGLTSEQIQAMACGKS